jgi:cystathionine gamma-lyase
MIDSTYNTPIHMRPLDLGVDVVIHSLTKYYGGHSNATGGAVIGSAAYIDKLIRSEVVMMGSLLGPFQSWLFTQGSRTLKLRLKQHEATANHIAGWLEQEPEIKVVHHLGLESYAQRDLVKSMMTGTSGLFSFETKQDEKAKVMDFCNRLQLFGRGISWGGFESLVVASHVKPCDYDSPRWFIRLFCGLEDAEDLQADIAQALVALR